MRMPVGYKPVIRMKYVVGILETKKKVEGNFAKRRGVKISSYANSCCRVFYTGISYEQVKLLFTTFRCSCKA